jgi:replicative DNA helicase
MGGPPKGQQNRQEEISGISRGLKMLGKEMGIPILALAQLSRDSEKGQRRPQLSDLRESGSLEQDASGVIFLWRDPEAQPAGDLGAFLTEALFCKQRNGALGTVPLAFESVITRFREAKNQGREAA